MFRSDVNTGRDHELAGGLLHPLRNTPSSCKGHAGLTDPAKKIGLQSERAYVAIQVPLPEGKKRGKFRKRQGKAPITVISMTSSCSLGTLVPCKNPLQPPVLRIQRLELHSHGSMRACNGKGGSYLALSLWGEALKPSTATEDNI